MAESFGISQVAEYFTTMDLKVAQVDREREVIELAFHGNYGQWRMIVGFQQSGDVRKLMLVVPQIATIKTKKRMECLEALMAVNYRIAMGKFGLDLEDGEVRLEETIPLADNLLTFAQFQLIFGAMMQTVAIYHNLLPRVMHSNAPISEIIRSCEQDFFQEEKELVRGTGSTGGFPRTIQQVEVEDENEEESPDLESPDLNVHDVLEEVTRLLRQGRD